MNRLTQSSSRTRMYLRHRLVGLALIIAALLVLTPVHSLAQTMPISNESATNDDSTLSYRFSYTSSYAYYRVYLDADRNLSTGFSTGGIGADYLLEGRNLFVYTGGGSDWTWQLTEEVAYSNTGSVASWRVPRADIGTTNATRVMFQVESPGFWSSAVYDHTYSGPALYDQYTDNTASTVSYGFSYIGSHSYFRVYIDTDRTASTGFRTREIGADYLLEGGNLFAYSGSGSTWNWQLYKAVDYANTGQTARWTINRVDVGATSPCNDVADVVFQVEGVRLETSDVLHQRFLTATSCAQQKMAIPAYFGAGIFWSQLNSAASSIGLVVFNPLNGPGAIRNAAYAEEIRKARASGIRVLGYVSTSWAGTDDTARTLAAAERDVDAYFTWYPNLDGIFLDETPPDCTHVENHANPFDDPLNNYYQPLYQHIKESASATGSIGTVVLNPGSYAVQECYMTAGDIILNFESTATAYQSWQLASTAWQRKYPANRFWHLVYGTSAAAMPAVIARAHQNNAGWVYVTPDDVPNPWDTLPSGTYWTNELKLITDQAVGQWDTHLGNAGMGGTDGTVYTLASDQRSNLYAGGLFTSAGGTAADYIARWDGTRWSTLGAGLPGGVKTVAVDQQGMVYAAGGSAAGGYLARWNGTTWSGLDGGAALTPFNGIYSLAIDQQNNLIVGGDFNQVGALRANSIVRWNPVTRTWSSFGATYPYGLSGWVETLAVGRDGTIYAGGRFGTGDEGVNPINLAAWDTTTQRWSAVGGGTNGTVYALTADRSGNLFAGGIFTRAGDTTVQNIAGWNQATQTWSAMSGGVNDQVFALAAAPDGAVYVGGRRFTKAGTVGASNVARWDPANHLWAALGKGTGNPVMALTLSGENTVVVAGAFTSIDGQSAKSIAQWIQSPAPDQ